jgi:putative sporulation protein YtaF
VEPVSLVLLAIALSLDSLMVGLVYGARRIRLPLGAIVVVSLSTGLLLFAAMAGGAAIATLLSPLVAQRTGALLLALVGLWVIYQTYMSGPTEPIEPEGSGSAPDAAKDVTIKVVSIKLGSVGIVVKILREPGAADMDRSGHISLGEAWILGIALALDSVAAGLGAGMAGFSPYGLPLAAAAGSFGVLWLGSRAAYRFPARLKGSWAMVHGLVLVALGLYRMVS